MPVNRRVGGELVKSHGGMLHSSRHEWPSVARSDWANLSKVILSGEAKAQKITYSKMSPFLMVKKRKEKSLPLRNTRGGVNVVLNGRKKPRSCDSGWRPPQVRAAGGRDGEQPGSCPELLPASRWAYECLCCAAENVLIHKWITD